MLSAEPTHQSKKRKMMSEAKVKSIQLKIYGNAITALMRDAAERGDIITVFKMIDGEWCTAQNILDIIEGRTELIGDNIEGFDIRRTNTKTPIDVQKRLDAFMERKKREGFHEGYDMACEGMARWARHENHNFVAECLESGDWFDPGSDEEDED